MGRWNVPMIVVVALLVVSPDVKAADSRMILRGGAGWIGSSGEWTGDLLVTEGVSVTNLKADSTTGPQVSLEYRFTHLIGGEVSVLQASHEIAETENVLSGGIPFPREGKFGSVTERPVLFGANFHVSRSKNFDFYLGPVIGWVLWGNLNPSAFAQQDVAIGSIKMHDDFAWGVNVGVDLPFAKRWVFNFDIRDLNYSATTDSPPIRAVLGEDLKIPIKPLTTTAGFGLRW
jgi:outer membrane protein W